MSGRLLELDAEALELVVLAQRLLADDDEVALRPLLHHRAQERQDVTSPLALLTGEALAVLCEALGTPWAYDERVWQERLPERRPHGRSDWAHANYALHVAGCLVGGLQLDWGRQESFWHVPLWPFQLDLLALLEAVAVRDAGLPRPGFHDRLSERLGRYAL